MLCTAKRTSTMTPTIEITAGEVNDVEARIFARFFGANAEQVVLKGTLRGPYCEGSRTLPAQIKFRHTGNPAQAEVLIPDPCIWSPDLPHLYQADIEAKRGDETVAEYRGAIGLGRASLITYFATIVSETADERG
jgi:hypothetical protein